ncbi:tRNA (adenosine(37)-N6)-threonylcarbamoyltransferase complex dimerization subunit type 1 TsaB [Neorhizobium galegae]|uniref:tRNA (adenosine(37)-N6)-threonylcarbamoyltransferase complex dimerization subunit type 1 TsaB n=1 Tax=Neorhizobium galegae TaxID=399 RepID=UPI002100A055|nr:tRNA (adenosine(37)-N6)-threonylcarbamoyltransferase complex dimerization subunit type 1 TsaB [Neorhizobium galegae]MCQ1573562.1 tRNA (adenosine(37)-N6)-threonylcarbamoyltransferase complex dimerization subunit type 1 TsaB [Neorhizobium galegae]
MIVLAIDTAGVDCSAALYDSAAGKVLSEVTETIGKGHAERLMSVIDEALAAAGLPLKAVERVAVVIGPGSFTGIRVGVAAARGLGLALGLETVGVTTLEALAAKFLGEHKGQPVVVAMDAKRNEVYTQAFSANGEALSQPAALSPEDASELARSLSAVMTGSWVEHSLGRGAVEHDGRDRFDIAVVARIAAEKPVDAQRPKPLYLRGPDAKPQTGFALARS